MATQTATPNSNGSLSRSHTAEIQEQKIAIAPKRRKASPKKAEEEGLLASLCALVCDHQIGIVVNLLSLLFLTHIFFPRARSRTTKFFQMSYYNAESKLYGCGSDDMPYVAFWTVMFTGMRVVVMEYLLDPLARLGGIKTKKGLDRFKEQAWLIVYYTASWSLGMYIMYHSDFWLNFHGIWQGWPFREIEGVFKWYYLVQWAFWIQQMLVVNIEEKRKDYTQMFVHHIFTTVLLYLSYGYYHTRVGIVILCIMDFVDIILPTAKLLKYMGYTTACDIAFGVFVISWLFTRHILYMLVCWSIYKDAPVDMAPGCYLTPNHPSAQNISQLFVPMSDTAAFNALGGNDIWGSLQKAYTDQNGPICWDPSIRYYFLGLLLFLQGICCVWFSMVLKVVYKVLSGTGADDVRSDDECSDEDELIEHDPTSSIFNAIPTCTESGMSAMPSLPREEEVGADALTFARLNGASQRRQVRRENSRTSGISIPGHGGKDLLGRIGCDKPS
ncbi:longevity-assurance protein-like protein [Ophiobolus disseminans]|uniref:Longevity-assurance protein-like protein n=1 Tax=Ophiobolus disseminans TaxID=1469910 RepID=A0A6A6ZBG7_9PLEO|nr:longevity-assurance protein-like protein [Ophiobolus disseminans]